MTVQSGGWKAARRLLRTFGRVQDTRFYNVLLMRAEDTRAFLEALREMAASEPAAVACLARVAPVETVFSFRRAEEFEARAREAIAHYATALAGKSFHVRIHRRGFKGRISSLDEERALAGTLLRALADAGTPARISFEDPDAIVAVETVGSQAGVALFTREDLARHPLLRPG